MNKKIVFVPEYRKKVSKHKRSSIHHLFPRVKDTPICSCQYTDVFEVI